MENITYLKIISTLIIVAFLIFLEIVLRNNLRKFTLKRKQKDVYPPYFIDFRGVTNEYFHLDRYFWFIFKNFIRLENSDRKKFNLEKTIKTHVTSWDKSSYVEENTRTIARYLILIQMNSEKDFLLKAIKTLFQKLNENGIDLEIFEFHSDINKIYKNKARCSLNTIFPIKSYENVIIVSDLKGFVDDFSGAIHENIYKNLNSEVTCLLSTINKNEWGEIEKILAKEYPLFPSTSKGILDLSAFLNNRNLKQDSFQENSIITVKEIIEQKPSYIVRKLKSRFTKLNFLWLSSLAVYHDLNWNLFLEFGNTVVCITNCTKA